MYEITGHSSITFFFPECVSTEENMKLLKQIAFNDVIKLNFGIKQTADYMPDDFSRLLVTLSSQTTIDILQFCQFTFETFHAQLLISFMSRACGIQCITFSGCSFVNYIRYHSTMPHLSVDLIFRRCNISNESLFDFVTFLVGNNPSTRFMVDNNVRTIASMQEKQECVY